MRESRNRGRKTKKLVKLQTGYQQRLIKKGWWRYQQPASTLSWATTSVQLLQVTCGCADRPDF